MALIALHWAHHGPSEGQHGFVTTLSRVLVRLRRQFTDWNSSATDREIARFIQRSGGRLTDAVEREIAERAITGDFGR